MIREVLKNGEITDHRLALKLIKESAHHQGMISGYTHNFYKYPACYSPIFPRTIIQAFTKPGDLILDPFLGGGTTAIESSLLGRTCYGFDINPIATFVAKFKTLKLTDNHITQIDQFFYSLNLSKRISLPIFDVPEKIKNVDPELVNFLAFLKASVKKLNDETVRHFVMGVILREAKYLADNPNREFDQESFIQDLISDYDEFIKALLLYQGEVNLVGKNYQVKSKAVINNVSSSSKKGLQLLAKTKDKFKLIVTSPPYPGKHILYNKWQPDGRKETYLPQWLIDSDTYESENHYLLGGRSTSGQNKYFESISEIYGSLRPHLCNTGLLVQMVAFSDRAEQFPRFLKSMNEAGFTEIKNISDSFDRRIWRKVPKPKWYNRTTARKCNEVVLFHRPK